MKWGLIVMGFFNSKPDSNLSYNQRDTLIECDYCFKSILNTDGYVTIREEREGKEGVIGDYHSRCFYEWFWVGGWADGRNKIKGKEKNNE